MFRDENRSDIKRKPNSSNPTQLNPPRDSSFKIPKFTSPFRRTWMLFDKRRWGSPLHLGLMQNHAYWAQNTASSVPRMLMGVPPSFPLPFPSSLLFGPEMCKIYQSAPFIKPRPRPRLRTPRTIIHLHPRQWTQIQNSQQAKNNSSSKTSSNKTEC